MSAQIMMEENEKHQHRIDESSMLQVGATLQDGKYRIERYLSSGGFGNTYEATNTFFDETVAIKEFFMSSLNVRDRESNHVSVGNSVNREHFETQREKFKKEARRLRTLHSDNIVAVHDMFEENGTAYYVMDFIDGESLGERLTRLGHPFTTDEVLDYLDQTLTALDVVHAQGMYHLDIKPGNLMVDATGHRLRVIDFGASKQVSPGTAVSMSQSSFTFTNGYAANELMQHLTKRIGPWTDLYALGATVYKLLTNHEPPSPTEILEEGRDAFAGIHDIDETLKTLILWMMHPLRNDRPQSVAEVRAFLANPNDFELPVNLGEPQMSDITTMAPASRPRAKRHITNSPADSSGDTQESLGEVATPRSKRALWIGAALVAAIVAALAIWMATRPAATPVAPVTVHDTIKVTQVDTVAPQQQEQPQPQATTQATKETKKRSSNKSARDEKPAKKVEKRQKERKADTSPKKENVEAEKTRILKRQGID